MKKDKEKYYASPENMGKETRMKNVSIIGVGNKVEITFSQNEQERTYSFSGMSENIGFGITPGVMINRFLMEDIGLQDIETVFMRRERI